MSVALMTLAFKTQLPSTAKFVLVALCDFANDQGECFPSVATLAEKCGLTDRAVQKALATLEAAGGFSRDRRNGRSTVYLVTPQSVQKQQQTDQKPPNVVHPRTTFTPNDVHPTPERRSPPPPNVVHPTPERGSPITIIEPSSEPSKEPSLSAGEACRSMRVNGLSDTNPGHPALLALIAAGITLPELSHAATVATEKGAGFAYALKVAESQRKRAAGIVKDLPRKQSTAERNAEAKRLLGFHDSPTAIT